MKNLGKFAALGAILAISASSAFAATITAGQQNVAVGTIASTSYTSGTLVATMSGTFSGPIGGPALDYSATYTASVYRGGSGATCATCLDFVYMITDVSGSSLESSSIFNFSGFSSNIFFVTGGNGTANDNLSGSSIQFELGALGNGSSASFVDFTNATSYGMGNLSVQNGVAGNAPAFAPATPEPNSLVLMGTGLVSGAGMLLRRRRSIA